MFALLNGVEKKKSGEEFTEVKKEARLHCELAMKRKKKVVGESEGQRKQRKVEN